MPAYGVFVEDDAIAANVKGQLPAPFRQHDHGFVQGVGVAEFVENVGVGRRNLGDDYVGFGQPLNNVLHDDARLVDVGSAISFYSRLGANRTDNFSEQFIIRRGELHHDESGAQASRYFHRAEFHRTGALGQNGNLPPFQWPPQDMIKHYGAVNTHGYPLTF